MVRSAAAYTALAGEARAARASGRRLSVDGWTTCEVRKSTFTERRRLLQMMVDRVLRDLAPTGAKNAKANQNAQQSPIT